VAVRTRKGRGRQAAKGLLFIAGSLVAAVVLLLLADAAVRVFLSDNSINMRGYRGGLVGPKQPGEWRVAMVGESTAYGWGISTNEAIPALLQARLQSRSPAPTSVVNLAYPNETAVCYRSTLQDYADLVPDLVVIYSGYNDLGLTFRPESSCFRNRSVVFHTTGYMPLLEQFVQEKWYRLRYDSVEEGYRREGQGVSVDELVAGNHGDHQFSSTFASAQMIMDHYNGLITQLVAEQLALGRSVLFVTQPYINDDHRQRQAALRVALQAFSNNPSFRYLDLGNTLDLEGRDRNLAFDRLHLKARGNVIVADAMVDTVASMRPASRQ
jgi:lysophospholipase L1-like esterase